MTCLSMAKLEASRNLGVMPENIDFQNSLSWGIKDWKFLDKHANRMDGGGGFHVQLPLKGGGKHQ